MLGVFIQMNKHKLLACRNTQYIHNEEDTGESQTSCLEESEEEVWTGLDLLGDDLECNYDGPYVITAGNSSIKLQFKDQINTYHCMCMLVRQSANHQNIQ